jgi:hypothetical protein
MKVSAFICCYFGMKCGREGEGNHYSNAFWIFCGLNRDNIGRARLQVHITHHSK